ncbi:hypothetical protein KGF56_002368 [Candida oxycetoniae]|uniref:Ubiquitin-like domain-containing protein n=1 Tax=Candida oxycetoniae TaxID=497107 RepID=A0AAI9WY00_9ASCO|nr:uncharacterized protein KGF56_002368 [Candida oxycetoniae]KAI3404851.1 hypothetical protein KGF56_002368 [Candida oxycetoniae]
MKKMPGSPDISKDNIINQSRVTDTTNDSSINQSLSKRIKICIEYDHSRSRHYKIDPDTMMRKVLSRFCSDYHLDINELKFLVDGTLVKFNDTPRELELENGDVISAVVRLYGG